MRTACQGVGYFYTNFNFYTRFYPSIDSASRCRKNPTSASDLCPEQAQVEFVTLQLNISVTYDVHVDYATMNVLKNCLLQIHFNTKSCINLQV